MAKQSVIVDEITIVNKNAPSSVLHNVDQAVSEIECQLNERMTGTEALNDDIPIRIIDLCNDAMDRWTDFRSEFRIFISPVNYTITKKMDMHVRIWIL